MEKQQCINCHSLMWEKETRPEMRTNIGVSQERQTRKFTVNADIREKIKKKDWTFFSDNEYFSCEIGCFRNVWKNKIFPIKEEEKRLKNILEFYNDVLKETTEKNRKKCNFYLPIQGEMDLETAEKLRKERLDSKKEKRKFVFKIIGIVLGVIGAVAIIIDILIRLKIISVGG